MRVFPPSSPCLIQGRAAFLREIRFGNIIAGQVLGWLFFSTILDTGVLLWAYTLSLVAFWGVAVVRIARKTSFNSNDVRFLQLGWIVIAAIGVPLIPILTNMAESLYDAASR